MALGMKVKLLDTKETQDLFKNDEIFRGLQQLRWTNSNDISVGVNIKCLEILYGGTTSAALTEIGTTMTAEFKGSANEVSTVLCATRVLTPGGSYFTFYVTDGTTVTTYYAWFSKYEVFTVVCDTRVNTPGGSSFAYQDSEGAPTTYYVWFSKKEVFTVECKAKADCVESSYFTFQDSEGAPTSFYLWLNKGAGVDPTPGGTGIEADISGATSATDVAAIIAPLINAKAGCVSGNVAELVTVTMATKGDPTDAVDVSTTFTVTVTENGGADPSGTGTGAECDISAATTANEIGVIVAGIIDALGGTGAANVAGTVTVTMATKGDPADAVDVDSGLVITITENGGADPSATGTGAECDIKAATTAADVGAIVQGVIDALGNVTATGTTTVLIVNDIHGLVTATTDGNTGFTITQLEQSVNSHQGAPIYVKSAQADDTDNVAKDFRKDTVIGFNNPVSGVPELKSEEIAMNGATQVKSAELRWTRIVHHGGSDWGSAGQDAKGNISLTDYDGTVFLVITAAGNESEGGVIWLPNHFHAMIAEMQLDLNDLAVAAAIDGALVKFIMSGMDPTKNNRVYNLDEDHPDIPISVTLAKPHELKKYPLKSILHGSDVAKLTLQESKITTATTFIFKTYILIWYQKNPTT